MSIDNKFYGKLQFSGGYWMLLADPQTESRFKVIFPNFVYCNPTKHEIFTQTNIYSKVSYSDIKKYKPGLVNNITNCKDLQWFMQRYPLEMSATDQKTMNETVAEHEDRERRLRLIFNESFSGPSLEMAVELRKYQKQAVQYFFETGSLLLGDDVGLGKTLSSLAPLSKPEYRPTLIIVQPHLMSQWKAEVERAFPGISVHIVKGLKPYELPETEVVIIAYTRLRGWKDDMPRKFRYVIFDEVQELRHDTSQKYEAAFKITERIKRKIGLSATPIFNYGSEIFNVMNTLKPGCLGEKRDFEDTWCETYDKRIVKDPIALGKMLRDNHLMLRRTREDVQRELPPINRIIHTLEYDEKQADKMNKTAIDLAIGLLTAKDKERGEAALKLDGFLRQATGVLKAPSVAAWVKVLLEAGEQVLLMGWHRACYDIWMQDLMEYNPVLYTGSENVVEKDKAKEKFISGESRIMIMSLRSGAGLNDLQKVCSHIVYGELDWSPATHHQATGRLNRDDLKGPVTEIFLIADTGSDPMMVQTLALKESQMDGVVNADTEYAAPVVSNADRIIKMAENLLAKQGAGGKITKKGAKKKEIFLVPAIKESEESSDKHPEN